MRVTTVTPSRGPRGAVKNGPRIGWVAVKTHLINLLSQPIVSKASPEALFVLDASSEQCQKLLHRCNWIRFLWPFHVLSLLSGWPKKTNFPHWKLRAATIIAFFFLTESTSQWLVLMSETMENHCLNILDSRGHNKYSQIPQSWWMIQWEKTNKISKSKTCLKHIPFFLVHVSKARVNHPRCYKPSKHR